MTAKNTFRFIDKLPEFLSAYNHTSHSSTGLKPIEVNAENQQDVWERLYESRSWLRKSSTSRLVVGDHVRITKARGTFERGYTPNWSKEIFKVSSRESQQRTRGGNVL